MVIQESIVDCKAECEAYYLILTFMESQINQAKPSELSRETVIPSLECVKDDKSGRVETYCSLWRNQSFGGQRQKTVCNNEYIYIYIYIYICVCVCVSINQSIGIYRMRWFLAVLRSLFHSSLSYTFSCHSSPPTILPSSLTSSSHLFLGLPLGLVVSRFKYNTLLGILFSSVLCTCPNQRNLCSLIVSVTVYISVPLQARGTQRVPGS